MSRSTIARVLALALAAFSLAACSGDDGGETQAGGSTSTETAAAVPVEDYLDGLCTAIVDYQDELASLNTDLETELSGEIPSPDSVKDLLVAFLDDAVVATQGLAEEVRSLGSPDVDGGDEIAVTFVNAFEQVEDLFATSRSDVDALATDDPVALTEGLQEVATNLQSGGEQIASVFDTLPEDDIDVNPEDVPSCQGLV
jgi:predicted small secreted protein